MINTTCIDCKNYNMGRACKAFEKIPSKIWNGENDHSQPLPGQKNKIVFEPLEDAKKEKT